MNIFYCLLLLVTYLNISNVYEYIGYNNIVEHVFHRHKYNNQDWVQEFDDVTGDFSVGYNEYIIPHAVTILHEYTSFMSLSYPNFDKSTIIDASLTITKKSGDLQIMTVSYYTYIPDFTSTTLPTPSGSLGLFYISGSIFEIDLTNIIANSSIGKIRYLSFSRSYSTIYGEFYNYDIGVLANSPALTIHSSQTMSSNTYGSAPTYVYNYPGNPNNNYWRYNCYYYAIQHFGDHNETTSFPYGKNQPYSETFIVSTSIPQIINYAFENDEIWLRTIDSYYSPIFQFEYRIAYRVSVVENNNQQIINGYHFMRQNIDGSWSDQQPSQQTIQFTVGCPDDDEWWEIRSNTYISETHYFAVSIF